MNEEVNEGNDQMNEDVNEGYDQMDEDVIEGKNEDELTIYSRNAIYVYDKSDEGW